MNRKRILTRNHNRCLNICLEDAIPVQIDASDFTDAAFTGRIYTGRIQNIVRNIGAVFVEYQKGQTAYLDFREVPQAKIGDVFPVQITREAAGSKSPRCTSKLTLNGRFSVLVQDSKTIAVSSKITDRMLRKKLKETWQCCVTEEYGFILRTNSIRAKEEEIREEFTQLEACYRRIQKGRYQTPFTLLYAPPAPYLTEIRDRDLTVPTEIVTDQPDLYVQLNEFFSDRPDTLTIRFYDDPALSLYRLYSMERLLTEATQSRVWLKSGAYLVIEPTEAMVVIDVNSGRAVFGRSGRAETLLRINMEAAAETARQLRLRNLSGIVVIDFIDLPDAEKEEQLLSFLRECLKADPVRAEVIEMTKLKFAVLTREKVRMPLVQQLRNSRDETFS